MLQFSSDLLLVYGKNFSQLKCVDLLFKKFLTVAFYGIGLNPFIYWHLIDGVPNSKALFCQFNDVMFLQWVMRLLVMVEWRRGCFSSFHFVGS